jgi:H+/Cl- antiporter ClcA
MLLHLIIGYLALGIIIHPLLHMALIACRFNPGMPRNNRPSTIFLWFFTLIVFWPLAYGLVLGEWMRKWSQWLRKNNDRYRNDCGSW